MNIYQKQIAKLSCTNFFILYSCNLSYRKVRILTRERYKNGIYNSRTI